jgi:hypothetical protein
MDCDAITLGSGFPWLEVQCSRYKTMSSVGLAIIRRSHNSPVHTLEAVLLCRKCDQAKWRLAASCISLHRASGIFPKLVKQMRIAHLRDLCARLTNENRL